MATPTPTPAQFVADHGDPISWSATDHDTYDTLARTERARPDTDFPQKETE